MSLHQLAHARVTAHLESPSRALDRSIPKSDFRFGTQIKSENPTHVGTQPKRYSGADHQAHSHQQYHPVWELGPHGVRGSLHSPIPKHTKHFPFSIWRDPISNHARHRQRKANLWPSSLIWNFRFLNLAQVWQGIPIRVEIEGRK